MSFSEQVQQAAALLRQSKHAIALTGAGISTPSGIPDFRTGTAGLWEKYDPMLVASIMSFRQHPEIFYEWVRPLIRTLQQAQPNPAHYALAHLEELGILHSVITQNIDLLHSRAGSKVVYEVHGHVRDMTCIECFSVFPAEPIIQQFLADESIKILHCPKCGGVLKPNVILFGEQLPARALEAAEREARRCDLMLVAGSSLEVYPVADLPRRAQANDAKLILINYHPTLYDKIADVVINGNVAEVLPQIVEAVEKSAYG